MKIALKLWLLLALAAVQNSLRADEDAFAAKQQSAVAQNPIGVVCTLRLTDGKTRFQQGETIRVTAEFTADKPDFYKLIVTQEPRFGLFQFGRFYVAPQEGVGDPLGDLTSQGFEGHSMSGPPVPLSEKPIALTVALNEWLRFDRPGHYRVYATSHRVLDANDKYYYAGKHAVASSIIEFDIVPADPEWAHAQVQAGHGWLLGTPEAAQAILERMGANTWPRSSEAENWAWRPALVGFPDRAWLIGEMERALARPDYTVTPGFVDTLALLAALRREPKPPDLAEIGAPLTPDRVRRLRDWVERLRTAQTSELARCWQAVAEAVPRKPNRVRVMTLYTLLELGWRDGRLNRDSAVIQRLPQLAAQIAPIFDQLPEESLQYHLLGGEWPRLHHRVADQALLPGLRRLWASRRASGQRPAPGQRPGLLDLILRRLYEVAPPEGRALLLKEIASPQPRASLNMLSILPDATLPQMDATLLTNAIGKPGSGYGPEVSFQLLARYASPRILPQVKALHEAQAVRCQAGLLAYFLRVAPAYGAAQIEVALTDRPDSGCFLGVLGAVAALRTTPELERIAIAHLDDAVLQVQTDAAQMLRDHGSPAARNALLARLKRTNDLKYPGARERIEWVLVDALINGQGWRVDDAQLAAIRALCHTDVGRRIVDAHLPRNRAATGDTAKVDLQVEYPLEDGAHWRVEQYEGHGLASFQRKVAQFPRGTVFSWQDLDTGPDADALAAQIRVFVQARGMTLERWTAGR